MKHNSHTCRIEGVYDSKLVQLLCDVKEGKYDKKSVHISLIGSLLQEVLVNILRVGEIAVLG